jgi:TrmH family RNA methyltransferase
MSGTPWQPRNTSINAEGDPSWYWPPETVISSRSNTLVKQVRALAQRKARDETATFLTEGILPVWRAVENGARIVTLVVAPDLLRSHRAREMVAEQSERGLPVAAFSADLFRTLVERNHPSGLAAVVAARPVRLPDLDVQHHSIFSIFYTPSNPGNLGACLRTIEATAGAGAIVAGGGTDIYHPTAVKASMGALFSLPVVAQAEWPVVRTWCAEHGITLVATTSHATQDLWQAPLPRPLAVVFGNEGAGLPDEVIRDCQSATVIPMAHGGSLNMAVATAVVLFELRRRLLADNSGHT